MSDHRIESSIGPSGGEDYDDLPYPSMPFAYTQPAHLAALAMLHGLEAPPADRSRVLELGCASGGNIIPLAARFPRARFVGVDLSARHIRDGRRRIEQLSLANIELRQADLASASFVEERFDYIICHGVFSWVPPATRDAIFRICRDVLAPNGLAFISYNVLPGWHLRNVIRDICIHHADPSDAPRERVAQARRALAEIAASANPAEPYGLILRNEAERLGRLPAAYLLGEFLAASNAPMLFSAFAERARAHNLSYLCEVDLGASVAETAIPGAESTKALGADARLLREQSNDFVSGRPFRRSVLVHTEQEARILSPPAAERLRSLHFAARLVRQPGTVGTFHYKDARDRSIRTTDAAVDLAFMRLAEAFPSTLSLDVLAAPGNGRSDQAAVDETAADREMRVCRALLSLLASGQATASTLPLRVGRQDTDRPELWPLARIEAASGQPWLTSLSHEAVPRQGLPTDLLSDLDGTRDRSVLQARLIAERRSTMQNQSASSLQTEAAGYLDRALEKLALHALLER
jgi:SAM-dependent methyltransferase